MSETEIAAGIILGDIYVVMGEEGEYSDRVEWSIAYYLKQVDAQAHVQLCASRLAEWEQREDSDIFTEEAEAFLQGYDFGEHFNPKDFVEWRHYGHMRFFYRTVKPGTMMETIRSNKHD